MLRNLIAAYRQITTPLVNLCFATALGAAAMAAVASLVNRFITPWSIATGMLCVSGFYLLMGVGYLIQHSLSAEKIEADSANPPAPLGLNMEAPATATDHAHAPGREMARA
jgi:hypothetical protein